jgi:hypothetical protein
MLRKSLAVLAVLAMGGLALKSAPVSADTITVHSLTENPTTGVFTYAISLDAAADVAKNDGFVIYDFPGLTSWSIAGGLTSTQFLMNSTLTSNTLNVASAVDLNGSVAASSNGLSFDNASVPNLSFDYKGPPTPFLGATTAVLTLTSSVHGGIGASVYASVDHSGISPLISPFSFSANPVLVPAPGVGNGTPLPRASVGGAVLFGLLGLGQLRKRILA